MSSSARRIRSHIAAFMLAGAGFAGSASAAIVHSGPVSIPIPDNIDGVYLNVVTGATGATGAAVPGWDANLYSAASTQFNLWGWSTQVWFAPSGVIAGPYPLAPGTAISGAATTFFRPGGSLNVGTQVTLNSDQNLFGMRIQNEATANSIHFGWVRVQFGATASQRTIVEYAWENVANTAINAGDIGAPVNTAPTITPVGASATQGSSATAVTIANVSDAEDAEDTLAVTVNGGASATVNGVTVSGISTTAAGVVSANVAATCAATNASFTLRVTDSGTLFNEGTLNVQVAPNPAPTLTYAAASSVFGEDITVNPATGPSDNGSIAGVAIQDQGTYTGSVSVAGTGVVSFDDAAPVGTHNVVVRITDDCGAFTDATLALTVGQGQTTTSITSDTPDPSASGEAVTVVFAVAPVAPASGTPTGNVTVTDGVDSCSAAVAVGQCDITLTTDGTRSLTASYAGDVNFAASVSAAEPHEVTAAADLSIAKSVDRSELANGVVEYTIVVANDGPSDVTGATVADTFAAPQTNVEWTCVGSGGGTCSVNGTGDINQLVDLPAGGSVVFTVVADVPVPLEEEISNTATVTAPAGVDEIDTANNTATATVQLDSIFADGFEDP